MPTNKITFSPLSQAVTLVPLGDCTVADTTISKSAGVDAWDSNCYAETALGASGTVEFKAAAAGINVFAGLTTSPQNRTGWSWVDFAIYFYPDNIVRVYESGISKGTYAGYTTTDTFAVRYSDGVVSYLKNGVEFYRSTAATKGLALHFACAFSTAGDAITVSPYATTPLVFSRNRGHQIDDPKQVNVVTDYSEGRQLYAYDKGVQEQSFHLEMNGLTEDDFAGFEIWLTGVAVGPKNPFIFTDQLARTHTVRLMDTSNPLQQTDVGVYAGTITLRKEI